MPAPAPGAQITELAELAAFRHKHHLAGDSGDGLCRLVDRDMLDPLAFPVGQLAHRAVAAEPQQTAIVAAAHEAVARRISRERQRSASMHRLAGGRLWRRRIGRQEAHLPVAQRKGGCGAVAAEGAP